MFTLVSGVYRWLFSRPEICILLVGLQGSGKTTFFEQLKERYVKSGSKGAGGLSALENKSRLGPQDDRANQRQHDKQQQQDKWQQGRQQQVVTEEKHPRPNDKPQEGNHQGEHQWRKLRQHRNQQEHLVRNSDTAECARADEAIRDTCSLPQVSSTTGLNFCRFRYKDVDVILWDLAGVASFHAIWVDYYQNAHCVLYFVDSTLSAEGLKKSRSVLTTLISAAVTGLRKQTKDQKRGVCPPPLLIVAAKQDLAGALVPSRNSVQEVFSCDDEICCNRSSSAEGERTESHHPHGRGDFFSDLPEHKCRLGGLISHSAYRSDSVEKVLRCAVHAAKAYHEFLSLSLHEIDTQDASLPGEWALREVGARRRCAGSAELHGIHASKATPHEKYILLQNSRSWPVYSGRRGIGAGESARMLPCGTETQDFTVLNEGKPPARQPGHLGVQSRSVTDVLEVPCWHYATNFAAFAPPSGSGNPTTSHSFKSSRVEASQQTAGPGHDFAYAACPDIPSTAACECSVPSVPFVIAAPQQICEARGKWSSSATDREAKVKRELSGLYELDDC